MPARKPEWRPGFPASTGRFMVAVLAVESIVRGLDYVTGDDRATTVFSSTVEKALPLVFWGAAYIAAGLVVIVGMSVKRYRLIMVGSYIAGATYGATAYGLIVHIAGMGWPPDGWRSAWLALTMGLLWFGVGAGTRLTQAIDEDREARFNG